MAYIKAPKPEQQNMYDFLEDLRQSGECNMFGAGPYLQGEYGLSRSEAKDIVLDWMEGHDDPERQMAGPATAAKAGRIVTTYEPADQ